MASIASLTRSALLIGGLLALAVPALADEPHCTGGGSLTGREPMLVVLVRDSRVILSAQADSPRARSARWSGRAPASVLPQDDSLVTAFLSLFERGDGGETVHRVAAGRDRQSGQAVLVAAGDRLGANAVSGNIQAGQFSAIVRAQLMENGWVESAHQAYVRLLNVHLAPGWDASAITGASGHTLLEGSSYQFAAAPEAGLALAHQPSGNERARFRLLVTGGPDTHATLVPAPGGMASYTEVLASFHAFLQGEF